MVAHVGNLLAWSDRSCDRDQQGIVLRIIHGGAPLIVENAAEIPLAEPSSDDCYTSLLHDPTESFSGSSAAANLRWSSPRRAGSPFAFTFRSDQIRLVLVVRRARVRY